jgi:hypothetical protein
MDTVYSGVVIIMMSQSKSLLMFFLMQDSIYHTLVMDSSWFKTQIAKISKSLADIDATPYNKKRFFLRLLFFMHGSQLGRFGLI